MSKSKAKRKQLAGHNRTQPGRTPPRRRPSPGSDLPVLPIAVGLVILAVLIGLLVYAKINTGTVTDPTATIDGIRCDVGEMTANHYHAHLAIYNAGQPVAIPTDVGRPATCFYWLHTHAITGDDGVIHIEAPAGKTFTLGNFFDVWRQPLSSTNVAGLQVAKGQKLVVFVDGQPYTGDPRAIQLKAHELIVLEITPPQLPPPAFTFPTNE